MPLHLLGRAIAAREYVGRDAAHWFHFEAFPRRALYFALRLYGSNDQVKAEFKLKNPVRGPFPIWQAEPLPTARTNGDLVFTLHEISATPAVDPNLKGAHGLTCRAQVDVSRDGQTVPGWKQESLVISDATGNRGAVFFCRLEPVLKVEATLSRTAEAAFDQSEIWRIEHLTVPESGATTPVRKSRQISQALLEVLAVAGAGRYVWSNDVCIAARALDPSDRSPSRSGEEGGSGYRIDTYSVPQPHVVLKILDWQGTERITLRGQDDQGRSFIGSTLREFPGTPKRTNDLRTCEFDLPEGAKFINLEFIVHHPITVEFFVKPPRP